jgi:DNA-binding response OmpR family regulator
MKQHDSAVKWAEDIELEEKEVRVRAVRVLLAEDDAEMRRIIAMVLRRDGYDVVEAKNGVEILHYLGSSQLHGRLFDIDIIISDIRMPGLSGLEILSDLRAGGWLTPVILITGFGDEETHARARRLGVSAVFDKPFDLKDLLAEVHRIAPPL